MVIWNWSFLNNSQNLEPLIIMKQTILKQYIRNPKTNQPRGVAVAVKHNNEIRYGFSLLNTKMDKFDKTVGYNIAMNRAMSDAYSLPNTPERENMVMDAFNSLEQRALKYFKDLDPLNIKLQMESQQDDIINSNSPNFYEL